MAGTLSEPAWRRRRLKIPPSSATGMVHPAHIPTAIGPDMASLITAVRNKLAGPPILVTMAEASRQKTFSRLSWTQAVTY